MIGLRNILRRLWTMAMEKTYIMLKPDCIKRGLIGEVITRIERKGFKIVDAKMMNLDEAILREHYAHMTDKPFFPRIVEYMTSGPVLGMVVEGENAVVGMRILMGATHFDEATAGTIRGDLANSLGENIIHGSDSAESAKIEIQRFFG
jgi:nucleoside-diphosphate kinase